MRRRNDMSALVPSFLHCNVSLPRLHTAQRVRAWYRDTLSRLHFLQVKHSQVAGLAQEGSPPKLIVDFASHDHGSHCQ